MYDRILIPTDGSEGTAEAVNHGLEIARRFDGTIHVLSVIDETYPAVEWDFVTEREEERATGAVESVAERAEQLAIPVERTVRRGAPHEEIVDYAESNDVDLIAMGTHGRTGLGRFASAGSVAERVVRHAPVPVLTARLA